MDQYLSQKLLILHSCGEPLEVILINGESDSLTTISYQVYLDDCASGKEVNGMTDKIDCEARGTRFGPATAVLVKDYYTCGCGWAVSVK